MDNSSQIIRLLEEIKVQMQGIYGSMPDLNNTEKLLAAILEELKKS